MPKEEKTVDIDASGPETEVEIKEEKKEVEIVEPVKEEPVVEKEETKVEEKIEEKIEDHPLFELAIDKFKGKLIK